MRSSLFGVFPRGRRAHVAALAVTLILCSVSACGAGDSVVDQARAPVEPMHPLLGRRAPDFAKTTVPGRTAIAIHNLTGKVAVVDFWATWCGPCRQSFPKLQALHSKYGGRGLEIVAVSEDDDASPIPSFEADLGTKFPVVWDNNRAIALKWQPKSMPSTFILDRTGTVRFVHLGYHDDEELTIEREIRSLL